MIDVFLYPVTASPVEVRLRNPTVAYTLTASGSLLQQSHTLAGSGVLTFDGSASLSQAAQVISGTGLLTFSGSGASNQAAQTISGAGVLSFSGSGSVVQAVQTAAGSGTLTFSGNGTLNQSAQAVAGSGVLTFTGSGAGSQAAALSSGTGTLILTYRYPIDLRIGGGNPVSSASTPAGGSAIEVSDTGADPNTRPAGASESPSPGVGSNQTAGRAESTKFKI